MALPLHEAFPNSSLHSHFHQKKKKGSATPSLDNVPQTVTPGWLSWISMGRRLEKNYLFCEPCFLSLFRP